MAEGFVKLDNKLQIKYSDKVIIGGTNMYKYNVLLTDVKDNKIQTFYTQEIINVETVNKQEFANYILSEINKKTNNENVFIDLEVLANGKDTNTYDGHENGTYGKEKNSISATNSMDTSKNTTNNMSYSITSYDKFDEAIQTISNMSCPNINLKHMLNNSSDLPENYKSYGSEIASIAKKAQNYFGNMPVEEFVTEFKIGYSEIFNEVANTIITDLELKARNAEMQLPVETIMSGYSVTDFNNEIISLCENIKNGSMAISTLSQITSALNDIRGKYFYSSKETNMDILEASTLTEEDLRDLNMTEKEKKVYLENIKQKNESLYLMLSQTTNISRDEFNELLNNNHEKLAKMMEEISIKSSKEFNSSGNDNSYNKFLYEMMNDYYSSEVGQNKLLNQFIEESGSKYDEYGAIGKSKYIEYCISLNHSQDWLLEELKPYAVILDRINWDNNFCDFEVIKDNSTLDYISKWQTGLNNLNGISEKKILPFGIVYVDGEYKQRVYNQFGENMLQYLDYHMGENIGNTGSKMIVTAFSTQGIIDAVERDYKGRWIEEHKDTVKSSGSLEDVYKQAEEDYYILNGVINNKERYEKLINSSEVSFKDVYVYTNATGNNVTDILNKEYLEVNKENIKEFSNLLKQQEDQLYNFSVENNLEIGDGFGSDAIEAGVGAIASFMASIGVTGVEIGTGVAKHLEGWYDAANIALNSDLALFTKGSVDGNITIDLVQLSKLSKDVQSFRKEAWNDFSKTNLYKEQFETYKNDGTADKAVKAYYDKYLYDNMTGTYNALDGKKYYLYEDIPLSVKEQLIPILFKENKMIEWSLNNSSSSDIYVAAYKEAIRNGGDFTRFDSLSDKIKENASEQFEAMEEISKDHVTEYTEKNIFENEFYKDLEKLSFIKHGNILGMTANQIGNMAIPVLASAVVPGFGQALSSGLLFISAFGGAAEEAIKSGGSYNEALNYAALSATTEILIEKVFSGVAGYGEGWFDDVLEGAANKVINGVDVLINKTIDLDKNLLKNSVFAQIVKETTLKGVGEGVEEVVTDLVTPLWQSLTYLNDMSYKEIVSQNVSLESLGQTFLVSFLSSMVFGASEITQKTNNFKNQLKGLEQYISEVPGLKEHANSVLAEIIGYGAYEKGITKTDIINEVISRKVNELVNNKASKEALQEIQDKITIFNEKLSHNYVNMNIGKKNIHIPKSVVLNIADSLGVTDGYYIYDGFLIFNNSKVQNAFLSEIYNQAQNELNSELFNGVIETINMNSKFNDLSFVIKTISESLNTDNNVENIVIEYNGNEITIPKNIVEEVISNPNIDENGRLIFDEETTVEDFVFAIKEHAKLVVKNGINSDLYVGTSDGNSFNEQYRNAIEKVDNTRSEIKLFDEDLKSGTYSQIDKAINIIKDNTGIATTKVVVTDSVKVNNQNLIKLEVQAVVDGKQKQVNVYVDSTSGDIAFNKEKKVTDKIHEMIEQNKESENVYIGEIKFDEKQNNVIVTQNDANKAFVYYLNTGIISSVASTTSVRTKNTQKIQVEKSSDTKQQESDNRNNYIFDLSKINLMFDNITKNMESFIQKMKVDYLKVIENKSFSKIALDNFRLEYQQMFNEKVNEYLQKINDVKNRTLDSIDNLISQLNDEDSLKVIYEKQRRKLFDLIQEKTSVFMENVRISYQNEIASLPVSRSQIIIDASDVLVGAKVRDGKYRMTNDAFMHLTQIPITKVSTTENLNIEKVLIEENKKHNETFFDEDLGVPISNSDIFDVKTVSKSGEIILMHVDVSFISSLVKDSNKAILALEGVTASFIDVNNIEYDYYEDFILDAMYNYISYAEKNNISIEIDENIRKFYEAYKTAKQNSEKIINVYEVIEFSAEPIFESIYTVDSIKYGVSSKIKIIDLLNMIEGKTNVTLSFSQLTYALNELVKYINIKGFKLNKNIISILDQITNIDKNQIVVNPVEVFNGNKPIVVDKNIIVNKNTVSILKLIELMDNKTNFIGVISQNLVDENLIDIDIETAILELFRLSPELSNEYKDIPNLITLIKNNYVIFNNKSGNYLIIPNSHDFNEFEMVKSIIEMNVRELNKYINSIRINDIHKYVELFDSIIKFNTDLNLGVDMSHIISLRNKFDIKPAKNGIYGKLHYSYLFNEKRGGTYGPNQGEVSLELDSINLKSAFNKIFKREMTDTQYFEVLSTKVSQRKFDIILQNQYRRQNGILSRILGTSVNNDVSYQKVQKLKDIVKKNIPELNDKEAFMFLHYLEVGEIGEYGICSYADATSIIINEFLSKQAEFESIFGFPLYTVNEAGKEVYNYEMLLVDIYSSINRDALLEFNEESIKFSLSNEKQVFMSIVGTGLNQEVLNEYFTKKGISLSLNETFHFDSEKDSMNYGQILDEIRKNLESGNTVHLTARGFDLTNQKGEKIVENYDGHAMTVLGIDETGNLVVNSWSRLSVFNLREELLKTENQIIFEENGKKVIKNAKFDIQAFSLTESIGKTSDTNIRKSNLNNKQNIDFIDVSHERVESKQNTDNSKVEGQNIKQLSVLDNIKHTFVKANDKFTGFKASKLNSLSYYERTMKFNEILFRQKQINKTFRDFANKHLIDLQTLKENGLLKNPNVGDINPLITDNRVFTTKEISSVSIADIVGVSKNVDLDRNFNYLFNEEGTEFQIRSIELLRYPNDQILNVLGNSFKTHPIVISEVDNGKYIIEDNGYHRYSLLRLHYLNEYIKIKDSPELVSELNNKYTIPVEVYKLDYTKTYSISILKELGIDVKIKTSPVTKESTIFINGKKVIMSDNELIYYTKTLLAEKIKNQPNFIDVINNLLVKSDTFREFFAKNFDDIITETSRVNESYNRNTGYDETAENNLNGHFESIEDVQIGAKANFASLFKKLTIDLDLFKDILMNNRINSLSESELSTLIDCVKKGKIKLKDYNLNSETIGILIDKVPLQKIYPLSNVKAVKTFIKYFGKDTLVEFDKLNNSFLLGNNGEYLYNLFDYYDLSIPKTSETDKLKELNNLITNTINSNKKTEYKTYEFNHSYLVGTDFSRTHSELFLEENAPQDLKDAFYNGRVNSGNEYIQEWSKYLEGKSVKGIIHEPLISYEDVKVVENINVLGENSTKYNESLEELANRVGLTIYEVQEILSAKMQELIENSEFGIRRTAKSLESILETGKLKNQFEVNRSAFGVYNPDMRMAMERDLFGIPRNIRYEDRPIYGMLLPKDLSSKYVLKGPGSYYSEGSGVIYIFDKTKIINNATITLGDSLDQAGKVCATNLSNPKFFGMFSEMISTIKTKEDLLNFDFTSLYEKSIMEVGNSAYYEFQLHGEESHTLDNLKEIVFLKEPEAKIVEKLKELNISFRVIK